MSDANKWDQRFGEEGFAYGEEPNDFLAEKADQFPARGRILCLAEGEGRNAVFLAEQGHDVVAVDISRVGLEKAQKLAASRGVKITTHLSDLREFEVEPQAYDGVVAIWCHLLKPERREVFQRCVRGLKKNGIFLLEAYTPKQLEYKTGGPPVVERLSTLEDAKEELEGLEILYGEEKVREIQEGRLHRGPSAVVQVVAKKPEG